MVHRKLKIYEHEPYLKPGINSGTSKGGKRPAPLVAPR
jgi:hypothetical protein